jgi:DNA-binding CsgD family transcriptional regulator
MYRLIPLESFDQAGLPVLAADTDGTVRFYNRAAAGLFRCDMSEGLGRPCWRLARLRNRDGIPFCSRDCPVQREARARHPQTDHEVVLLSCSGERAEFDLLSFLVPPMLQGRWAILHMLRPVSIEATAGATSADPADPPVPTLPASLVAVNDPVIGRLHRLSTREREVMQLLVEGLDPTAVAGRLHISLTTVRNHVQNILRKLHLHRQVDAILAVARHAAFRPGPSPGSTDPPAAPEPR